MEVRYDVQQKELVIERQQTEMKQQRTRTLLFAGGFIAFVLLSVLLVFLVALRNKRNRELAETNAVKDKFFSIISHDLKNPAISQRDALLSLTKNAADWDAGTLSNYHAELLKSADGQVGLLNNLLNWSQVQTGRMPYNPVVFDLTAALRSDISLIKNMAEGKNIGFDVQMPKVVLVNGDENMIAAVVRNLLNNAVKFTPEGGTVTLQISKAPSNSPKGGGNPSLSEGLEEAFIVSVSDTGLGMSAEQMQNLFRLDRHQSREGTTGEQGTGLGLIVCRELLEKHGSALHIESEEGNGSKFWFTV
jgi:signal transduction histidine kinase